MEYVHFHNGDTMPVFGLGTWDLRGDTCVNIVAAAIEQGYTLIDTARMYGNEKEVGRGIRKAGHSRSDLFITTKIFNPDTTYEKTKRAIEDSLKNLGLDYIDLLLIHEPYASSLDMYEAMKEARQEGLVRHIGISNFSQREYTNFVRKCGVIPAVNQVESHVYYVKENLQRAMASYGTVMQAWAPFTEGQRPIFSEPILKDIASDHGKTTGQIALKYLIQRRIPTIAKTSRVERLNENLALFDFMLTADEMSAIHTLDEGKSLFGWYE